jgi:hypothetical protein
MYKQCISFTEETLISSPFHVIFSDLLLLFHIDFLDHLDGIHCMHPPKKIQKISFFSILAFILSSE